MEKKGFTFKFCNLQLCIYQKDIQLNSNLNEYYLFNKKCNMDFSYKTNRTLQLELHHDAWLCNI